jgi:hemoglobin-like flavoprotein
LSQINAFRTHIFDHHAARSVDMPLSQTQMALVRNSFSKIGKEYVPGSTTFYDKLFAREPDLREMFRDDIAGQGMKFMTTLGIIVDALDDPERLRDELGPLGEGHAALGVTVGHFAVMESALMDTFRATLGERFTPDIETAWRAAFEEIAKEMIALGGMR